MYSTSSMARTIELIFGLKPMSQFDAAAQPMVNAFQSKSDLAPYGTRRRRWTCRRRTRRRRGERSSRERFDFTKEDRADDLVLNEVVWRSVKGPDSAAPAPVRAAFVKPHGKADKDDDD